MSHLDASSDDRRGGGLFWFWTPILIILFVGAALSALAYMHGLGESPAGAIAAGFAGVVAVIVGVFAAAFAVVIAALGAVVAILAGIASVAVTLFIAGSPVIALVLLILLLRRPRREGKGEAAQSSL